MRSRRMLTSPVVVQVTREAAEGDTGRMDERRRGCGGAASRREARVHDGGRALCRAVRHDLRRVVSRTCAATGGGLGCTGCSVRTNVAMAWRGANGDHVVVRPGLPAETPRRGHLEAVSGRRTSERAAGGGAAWSYGSYGSWDGSDWRTWPSEATKEARCWLLLLLEIEPQKAVPHSTERPVVRM